MDNLRHELNEASIAYEKLRLESAREVASWKGKLGIRNSNSYSTKEELLSKQTNGNTNLLVNELRRRLLTVERELRLERLSRGVSVTGKRSSSAQRSAGNVSPKSGTPKAFSKSTTPVRHKSKTSSTNQTKDCKYYSSGEKSRIYATRSASPLLSGRKDTPGSLSTRVKRWGSGSSNGSASSSRHTSPLASSSLGKRFDPTAYQKEKLMKDLLAKTTTGFKGAITPKKTILTESPKSYSSLSRKHRYSPSSKYESGYTSANSQVSTFIFYLICNTIFITNNTCTVIKWIEKRLSQ